MLQKIASNYLNKAIRDIKYNRNARAYMFNTPQGMLPEDFTVNKLNNLVVKQAKRLVNSPTAGEWAKTEKLNSINKDFTGLPKCNLLLPQIHNTVMGKTYDSPFRNQQTGRWLSANDVYNIPTIGPTNASLRFKGSYTPVPYHLAPYAYGATIAQPGHVGVITDKAKSTSAATAKGLVENDWGFRKGNGPHDTRVAYILPKGMDASSLLDEAKARYNLDNIRKQHAPKWGDVLGILNNATE